MTNLNKTNHRHSEFISESNRHCEQSEAISSRLPRATALAMTEQTGRSMVEMLGVLAVIGVLSITGISGYTTAMNKHRANEILDAASKRAVVVSTQLQSGRTNPTLAEFGDDTVQGVSFSLKATDGNDWATGQERFAIQTSNIDEDICREIYNITGTSGTVREMYSGSNALSSSSGCSETASAMRFVYNNDLTNTASASDYKTESECKSPYTWCETLNKCQNSTEACECPTNSSTTGTGTGTIPNTNCKCNAKYKLAENSCVSILYSGKEDTWNNLNAATESVRCPDGGHWISLSELHELSDFGCPATIYEYCSSWYDGSVAGRPKGFTSTYTSDTFAVYVDWTGGVSDHPRGQYQGITVTEPALCIR